jgi:serine protease Do
MIRKTLQSTKRATFAIVIPNKGMVPLGTGFFVSPDGWFVTAAHCITDINKPDKPLRENIEKVWLMQESIVPPANYFQYVPPDKIYQHISVEYIDQSADFALMKLDFTANQNKGSPKDKTGFPYIEVSSRELDEGEPVYAFNYPLSSHFLKPDILGASHLAPRLTSTIVSSTDNSNALEQKWLKQKVYVLKKALNYGNNGGPIIAAETGKVHALCSGLQFVSIPQDPDGKSFSIKISGLYSVVTSFANPSILQKLNEFDIPISKM